MNAARILVVVPALNESRNIARVVQGILGKLPQADVLVINDGSLDDTGAAAAGAGAMVLHLPYNVGIGAAVQAGFQFADRHNYDIVLRNDGDGQHAPQANVDLVKQLRAQAVDVVIVRALSGMRAIMERPCCVGWAAGFWRGCCP